MKNICLLFVIVGLIVMPAKLFADEITLINGDTITGEVIGEDDETVTVSSEMLGALTLQRGFIAGIKSAKTIAQKTVNVPVVEDKAEPSLWKREIFVGYDEARGNTETNQINLDASANRVTDTTDLMVRGAVYYSSADREMDSQKWSALGRYAVDLPKNKWFYFYKCESDHDRFANINYRITPSIGVGYWFRKTDECTLLLEGSGGWEHTDYSDAAPKNDEAIGVIRGLVKKQIFEKAFISEDLTVYPSFGDFGEYRIISKTALKNPINDHLSLKLSVVDEYNSSAPAGSKKNDVRITSSLGYSF